ncbi:protein-disulfide reductase DsbD [Pseudomonas oryzihabitans]|uniref:protein-disulfide reductase DsbD n=1 Tax=Pseudomonas oryzihabitans TaxID=47885 RepID=UPI002859A25C|nr:protein-disulfide reductase DsbD [Pseudomonas psychrotolerans]MDR6678656.1 thiol:disulfide interchange protein DsbD [Pseudomonas psychrotolerans]
MRVLLLLLTLLLTLPAAAGLFDAPRPAADLGLNGQRSSQAFLPVDQAFRLEQHRDAEGRTVVRFTIAEGYYLYRQRFAFDATPGLLTGPVPLPPGEPKHDEWFGDVQVYHTGVDIPLPLAPNRGGQIKVTYQGCADRGLCYPPETRVLEIAGATTSPTATQGASPAVAEQGWRTRILFAFLAGLGLTFTPCVLPMLPIVSAVVLAGKARPGRGLLLALAYVVPMALSFAALGALMGVFGASLNLQAQLQSPWVLIPFALLFLLFALAMFGLFELRLPGALRDRLEHLASGTRGGSVGGAAVLGVLSSLIVSPCVSAPLAGLLLYISSTADWLGGGLALFALGLGMGTPLILVAAGGGALLPRSGAWLVGMRNAFGVLLLAVALWLLERLLPGPLALAAWGLLAAGVGLFLGALEFVPKAPRQRLLQLAGLALLLYGVTCGIGALRGASDPLRPLGESPVPLATTRQDGMRTLSDPQALAASLGQGRPVLVDVYADWCISCKLLEREVFDNPAVQAQLRDFTLIRFDMTQSTREQRQWLERQGLFGPPAVLFYDQHGKEGYASRIVGEIDAAAFLARLDQAKRLIASD